MPSPSWKRTKALSAISAPASLAAAATTSATGVLLSITNSWRQQRILLAELGEAAFDHLLDDVRPACRFPSPSPWRSRSRSTSAGRDRRRRAPAGWPPRCASRAACRAPSSVSAGRPLSSATSTPILPRPGRPGCGRRTRPRPAPPRATAARRSDWFSPIVAMLSVSFSSTVPPPG